MSRKSTIHFLVSFAIVIGLLFSVLLSMLASAPVRATDVGGQITSDTTWTKANSPYIVTSSVLVNEGVTLTVEPGVTVKFEALKGMLIDGQLVARGTASESITFTSSQTTPAKGDWVNIVFSEKSVDTNLDQGGGYLSGSILEYCTVEYGGASDQAALQFLSGTGTRVIEHCVIRNNASTGLRSQSTTLHVTSCTVSGNFAGGIYASDGQSTISGCTISGNSASYGGGIRGTGGPFTISGCTISTNSAYSGGGIDADGGPFVISDCTISGNSASYGGGIYAIGGPFTISGCTISGNSASNLGGGIHAIAIGGPFTISGCIISGNSASGWGGGIFAAGGPFAISGCTISTNSASHGGGIHARDGQSAVSSCTISTNSASEGGGIYAYGGPSTISGCIISGNSASNGGGIWAGSPVMISYSTIEDNMATAGKGGGVMYALGKISECNIDGNSPHDICSSASAGSTTDAAGNWWGTVDEAVIQVHIWDWFDDASLGIVDYVPYLTSEVDITLPSTPVVTDDGATTSNNTQLNASWSSADAESGIAEYQYAIGTTSGGTDVVGWTSTGTNTEVTKTGLSLNWGSTYYFSVKAKNGSGLWSVVGTSNGITVSDSTAPSTPVVTDDGATTSNNTQLHATWSSSDPESGIAEYQYAIGTTSGGTDVVGWTSTGTNTGVTKTGLSLTTGTQYYISVRAKNGAGVLSEVGASDGITVYPPPQADFSAATIALIAGQSVVFTDVSTGSITSWQWDFGDGTAPITWDNTIRPADGKITHSYTAEGTYTVSLAVSNPAASDVETKTGYIAVYPQPQADFSVGSIEVVPGQTVSFTSLSSGGIPSLSYAWDFDNDGTVDSTDQNPTHSYALAGTYTVSLKVTDPTGNSDAETKTGYITVIIATTRQDIPTQGGTIQTTDGQIAATFPADAVTSNAAVTIKQIPPSSAVDGPKGYKVGASYFTNHGIKVGSTCFTIEATDSDGNAIVTLSQPVTITVKYTEEDVAAAGGDPNNLVLAYWDEAAGEWVTLPTTVDTTEMTLSTTTSHLSQWAILAKSPSEGLAAWIWIVIGIAAAAGIGILAYFVRRRLVAR